jgi:NAD(P)H-hydrate repair Nnr-like enzyme with NAD(P)H-hydrate epimerase domain
MTVVLDGTGGILTRIGALYRWVEQIRLTAGGTGTAGRWPYELNDVFVKYEDAPNVIQAATDGLQQALLTTRSSVEQLNATLAQSAITTLIEMVDADDPLPSRTVEEALRRLIAQMQGATEDVAANTVSVTATAGGSNVGDGFMVADDLDEYGRQLENALAEDIVFNRNGSLQQFTGRGEVAASSRLAADWPLGSGCDQSVSAVNANADGGHVVNGSFEAFTANVPTGWDLITGTAGTHIKEEASTVFAGTKALEYDGDASNLTQIRQDIAAFVTARTPFYVGLFVKVDVTPAAGVLTIDLYDGTAVIQNDAGTNQSFTVDLTALTTAWEGVGAMFRIADPKPTNVWLRVRLTTALSNGTSLFMDNLTADDADRLYDGGPFVGLVAGATEFAADDTFVMQVTNNRSSVYQEAFDVFFDMAGKGLILPTDGSPSITNSLPTYEGS